MIFILRVEVHEIVAQKQTEQLGCVGRPRCVVCRAEGLCTTRAVHNLVATVEFLTHANMRSKG